jgi:catechol 2,3-dioxygenase-like lactoylglutathione lyase family enzyme
VPGISINHVSLSVVDMEESLRFYTEFLGMERIPGPEFGFRVEWLRVGDLELHLFERDTTAPLYHHVGFCVTNFEELYVRAKDTGILVHMPPFAQVTELPDGGAQMYVRDPGGNLIELDTPDASVLDRDVVEMRRLVDAIPQSDDNRRATLFLQPRPAD